MKSIDRNYQYFLNNRDYLARHYYGRFIIIYNQQVVEDFDSEIKAYIEGKKKYGLGNFIIQYCVPEEEEQFQSFRSPIVED